VEEIRAAEQRDAALIKAHCNKCMKRAFPGILQLTAAGMITVYRSQKDLDYIANVVRYWEPGVKIKEMESGYERDWLQEFCKKHPNRAKFANSIH
jgi:hypothetical protein